MYRVALAAAPGTGEIQGGGPQPDRPSQKLSIGIHVHDKASAGLEGRVVEASSRERDFRGAGSFARPMEGQDSGDRSWGFMDLIGG